MTDRVEGAGRERLAERVTAASYATVLVLATLAAFGAHDVESGLGWELLAGVGAATWLAHLYAEIVGDHIRHGSALNREEVGRAMSDGVPILLAPVLPAFVLGLGRLDVIDARFALLAAVVIAGLQLVVVGAFVGRAVSSGGKTTWSYAAVTAVVGLIVVALKVVLGH